MSLIERALVVAIDSLAYAEILADPSTRDELAVCLGGSSDLAWIDELISAARELRQRVAAIEGAPGVTAILALRDPVQRVVAAIGNAQAPGLDATEVTRVVAGFIVERYLRETLPLAGALLGLVGVLDRSADGEPVRLRPERIAALAGGLAAWSEAVYGWRRDFAPAKLIDSIARVAEALWLDPQRTAVNAGGAEVVVPVVRHGRLGEDHGEVVLAIRAERLPSGRGSLIVRGSASCAIDAVFALGTWTVTAALDLAAVARLAMSPGLPIEFDFVLDEDGASASAASITLARDAAAETVWLAGPAGLSISSRGGSCALRATGDLDSADLTISIDLGTVTLRLDPASVPLLERLGAREAVECTFAVTVSYSRARGLEVGGGPRLERRIDVDRAAGPIGLRYMHIGVLPVPGGIAIALSAAVSFELGPVFGEVDDFGVEIVVDFSKRGALGVADLGWRFKQPSGIAVAIAAGPVKGGGFLSFDAEQRRYAGAIQLAFEQLSLAAIGVLDLRDGAEPRYSLLVIICASFPPIQIGFGFTLNGVGGLLALHRSMALDALRGGVRTGALRSILFPSDPVRSGPRLVETLGAIFPPAPGRFVIGPMVRIGWGTPALLTAELAVVVELPAPARIAILGRVLLALPPGAADAVVRIQLDSVGTLSFDRGEATLDATLYDSTIAGFPVSGDMALRVRWKQGATFVLSAGGFHPAFAPPEGFPALQRLALTVSRSDSVRLRLEAYLAVTSNTIQFGGAAELYAAKSGVSVTGALQIDTLIQLRPFGLVVDIACQVAVRVRNRTLVAVRLWGRLTGPAPWHLDARVRFEVLWLHYEVHFEVDIGESLPPGPPPPFDALAAVLDELGMPANWTIASHTSDVGVSLRPPRHDDLVRAHPLDRALTFRQRRVPLGVTLDHVGGASIAGPTCVRITAVTVGAVTFASPPPVLDGFARAQFFHLTDEEQLTSPAFEQLPCGMAVQLDGLDYDELAADDVALSDYEWVRAGGPDAFAQATVRAVSRARLCAVAPAIDEVLIDQLARSFAVVSSPRGPAASERFATYTQARASAGASRERGRLAIIRER